MTETGMAGQFQLTVRVALVIEIVSRIPSMIISLTRGWIPAAQGTPNDFMDATTSRVGQPDRLSNTPVQTEALWLA